jgi:Cu-processing system ATP-binding protein
MTTPAIELDSATKSYGAHRAVVDVDLTVGKGETLALLGPNGAGKTTLIKLMLGLVRLNSGRVRVLGGDPAGPDSENIRRFIGFLPENLTLYDAMTGLEVLRFYARLKGAPMSGCASLLERVDLVDAARKRVRTYSKGMRQRLGLAQALLGSPRLLLLDEPTEGLDPVLRKAFYRIISEFKARGTTVVLSSHVLTELEARTDKVAMMKDGRLVAFASLDSLRREVRLPVSIRVSVENGTAPVVAGRLANGTILAEVNGRAVDVRCRVSEKMEVLRRIADLGTSVVDVELRPPTLDDIYSYYLDRGAAR